LAISFKLHKITAVAKWLQKISTFRILFGIYRIIESIIWPKKDNKMTEECQNGWAQQPTISEKKMCQQWFK
jgi:hypothetical protein